ncbi:MAG: deoxyribonuclease V [Acidobacteriota bacterium]
MPETGVRHAWDLTPREAARLQLELAGKVRTDLALGTVRRVAGADIAYSKITGRSYAAVCVLSFPGLQLLETVTFSGPTPFPYVPGLLSFREVPILLEAFGRLSSPPDLVLVDGHGFAHPRRFGIACHFGLWLGLPTVGVAKSRLCGAYEEPGPERGDWSPLTDGDEVLGAVLRTRRAVRPVFVSIGYGIPLEVCIDWVLRLCSRYRLPEPVRRADALAEQVKRAAEGRTG